MSTVKSIEFLGTIGIAEERLTLIADLDCAENSEVLLTLVDGTQLLIGTSEWAQVFIVKPLEA